MWRAFGRSVRGASHRRREMPNQDALGWQPTPGGNLAIAVADGHGSQACFRSGTGAELAVKIALELLSGFDLAVDFSRSYLDDLEDDLKHRLIAQWRDAVAGHLALAPYTPEEMAKISHSRRNGPWTPYGSTLLAAIASESHLFLLQIGDGDILMVSDRACVSRPWPRDTRLLGVETTSLCTEDAASNIRLRLEPVSPQHPRLVLLCTDGYSNSFRADSGFLKVGTDLLEMIDEDGLESVERDLEGWLEEASRLGSGDDVTLGLLFRESNGG